MDKAELKRVLDAHRKWLRGEDGGARALLTGAVLTGALLTGALLTGADLARADLTGADLTGAVLTGANIYYPMSCPSEGAFIGWKKARNIDDGTSCIVKLMIYDDARRSSATGRKCRCDKVKVLTVYDMHGNEITANVCSMRDKSFRYVVGATIIVKDFDENRWNECSTGIHFFITREEAERYIG